MKKIGPNKFFYPIRAHRWTETFLFSLALVKSNSYNLSYILGWRPVILGPVVLLSTYSKDHPEIFLQIYRSIKKSHYKN